DAVGACDGVKNGKWGFHTKHEAQPWWQVDLGDVLNLDSLRIYNRVDFAARASHLTVLTSSDGNIFESVYQHDGSVFLGHPDGEPLHVSLDGRDARFVRLQLPGTDYFHLDEVEVYAAGTDENIALHKSCAQSSVSQWSVRHPHAETFATPLKTIVDRGLKLADSLQQMGVDVRSYLGPLRDASEQEEHQDLRRRVRWAVRRMSLANPLLDFDDLLFVKRAPATLPHISDQYYGWWSRPGGGIYILEDFKSDTPRVRCLTEDWPEGSFLRPDLSYDARRVLFAYCRHYPHVAEMEKVDKTALPQEAFYQIYEMNIDGSDVRQLTHGRYDDFDARYLPDGDIVFLSTRKGTFLQCTTQNTAGTLAQTLPDSYVRCGGDNRRPCAVYTLHRMDARGKNLRPISAFETFEYTPSVADDGRLLYTRWDYIDRFNGHFFSLWAANQDGTNPQLVYGNYTVKPQAILEARSVPNSNKILFTAGAHHSITGGSLALLDPSRGSEGLAPVTRLTPEVPFPETEEWDNTYYANPYPLSEDFYLTAWSPHRLPPHAGSTEVRDDRNPVNALGLYLGDRFGNLELLYRDEKISSMYPVPIRPRTKPPTHPSDLDWDGAQEGSFLVQDIYQGLAGVARGAVRRLRIVAVPPKPQPHMNQPCIGVSAEDPGKYVLGTVPVAADGSAFFHLPSGVPVFFQALDENGMALQTMRSLTYVMPNQTLSCIGCHETRDQAPPAATVPLALRQGPATLTPAPEGSWPLRFDRLVQPMLDRNCIACHNPDHENVAAANFDLTAENAYQNLIAFGEQDLEKLAFEKDRSEVGQCPARQSKLMALLAQDPAHQDVRLDADSLERLITWMDTYAHRQGSFSPDQEQQLVALRRRYQHLFTP
ncbi:MAG: discoidin domain-containing protein, partial [Phycisphaerales bacterium]